MGRNNRSKSKQLGGSVSPPSPNTVRSDEANRKRDESSSSADEVDKENVPVTRVPRSDILLPEDNKGVSKQIDLTTEDAEMLKTKADYDETTKDGLNLLDTNLQLLQTTITSLEQSGNAAELSNAENQNGEKVVEADTGSESNVTENPNLSSIAASVPASEEKLNDLPEAEPEKKTEEDQNVSLDETQEEMVEVQVAEIVVKQEADSTTDDEPLLDGILQLVSRCIAGCFIFIFLTAAVAIHSFQAFFDQFFSLFPKSVVDKISTFPPTWPSVDSFKIPYAEKLMSVYSNVLSRFSNANVQEDVPEAIPEAIPDESASTTENPQPSASQIHVN